jgi:hypothetical protein
VKADLELVEMAVIFVQVITLPVELSLSRRAFHPAIELSVADKGAWSRKFKLRRPECRLPVLTYKKKATDTYRHLVKNDFCKLSKMKPLQY